MSSPSHWRCDVCGYIHRGPEPPETCPVCGVGAEMFSPFEIAAPAAPAPARAWRCTVCDYVHEGAEPPGECPVCGASKSLFEPFEIPPAQTVQGDVQRIVVVGGGVAGLTAAEQARSAAPDVAITLVSKEPPLPYYRLNLTRFVAGEVDEAELTIKPQAWFEDQRIELRAGVAVTSIDRKRQELRLDDGSLIPYDRLILANGAHPFFPPLPGATREGVLALRTIDDAKALLERGGGAKHVLCLGGGLLGLETAAALRRKGPQVTIIEGFDWLLPRQLAEPAGRLLQRHLEERGMRVICGATVEELQGDEAVRAARLADGEELPADLVVVGTGVRPNSYLARQAGLEVKSGVVVDDYLFTSDPAILAAGDVADHRGVVYGIWPAAYAQGLVAGTNAVGGQLEFKGLAPSNQLKVVDVDLFSVGQFTPLDGSYQVIEHEEDGTYVRLVCRDGALVGANLYGDTSLATALKEAVDARAQLATMANVLEQIPQAALLCEGLGD